MAEPGADALCGHVEYQQIPIKESSPWPWEIWTWEGPGDNQEFYKEPSQSRYHP